jgi:hypothetical protein
MSFIYVVIENRIQQAIEYIKKNSDAKRAKVARDFDVSLQRLRFRLLEKSFASAVREVHDKRLTSDQNLTLMIYIRKLIIFDLNSRLNIITSAIRSCLCKTRANYLRLSQSIMYESLVECDVI